MLPPATTWPAGKDRSVNGETSAAWLAICVITCPVGLGMIVYGRKQKEVLPLAFGVAIAGYPYLIRTAWLAALAGVGLVVLFVVTRKYVQR